MVAFRANLARLHEHRARKRGTIVHKTVVLASFSAGVHIGQVPHRGHKLLVDRAAEQVGGALLQVYADDDPTESSVHDLVEQ